MYLPFFPLSLSLYPNSSSPLLTLHARIVIEAFSHFIRLCCRLEDPANRPSLHWGCPLSPFLPPLVLLPVQAEIYAHMLSTLFALKGGLSLFSFWGLALIYFPYNLYEGLLLLLLSCLHVCCLPASLVPPFCHSSNFSLALAFFLRVFACFLN